eukprot:TRINITY_DN2110_c0_g2_i1.p1 TRINITY_DN2110_c0_g2~~TRINITY_DN2110_c0_g2_i1.p1  ORF type:complete len:430 (+),score=69.01 TRINITY_DN2110_c0_g2_i1:82-1290(+)
MAPSVVRDGVEILKGRLYWLSTASPPRADTDQVHFFTIDDVLAYQPFVYDFGPVDLGMTHQYISLLRAKMSDPHLAGKQIVHYCSALDEKRANAAYLICAYMVVTHGMTPERSFEPFFDHDIEFQAFRDVSRGWSLFPLSILDCLRGLEAGIRLGWFDWNTFDVDDYIHFQQVENGDMNWIIPNKFLAFAGPFSRGVWEGYPAVTPSDLVPVFQHKSVEIVVRLNSKQYDANDFKSKGIKHVDLIFKDGSCPSSSIINNFLHVAERAVGAVAVHCKAGLGRTGTLIGLYAMKHYGITAREYIAWSRLCRPGSIIGPQQQFLCDMEREMFSLGAHKRAKMWRAVPSKFPCDSQVDHVARQMLELRIEAARNFTDDGQGEHLVRARQDIGAQIQRTFASCGLAN